MALFAVMAKEDYPALSEKIMQLYPDKFKKICPGQWFIVTDGTAQEVSDKIGLRGGPLGSVIVISVNGYYGYHGKDIWEWLAAKSEK